MSSVAKLAYSILVAFESTASHLFNIKFNGYRYEIVFDDINYFDQPTKDPINTKLNKLKLKIGDILSMQYDYGAGWEFTIELISIVPMEKEAGRRYPRVSEGIGKGILENVSINELIEAIQYTDKTGEAPTARDVISGKSYIWDYRNFDLEMCNARFYGAMQRVKNSYE